jgi:hypothetical protein
VKNCARDLIVHRCSFGGSVTHSQPLTACDWPAIPLT